MELRATQNKSNNEKVLATKTWFETLKIDIYPLESTFSHQSRHLLTGDSNFYDHWSYCLSDPSPSLDEAISPPFSPGLLATVSIRRWYIKASFPSEDILVPTDLPKSILTVVGPSAESVGAFSNLVRSFSGEVASVA